MSADQLTKEELEVWHAVKRLSEVLMSRVGEDIEAATGLSGADFAVLSRVEDLGSGQLPQHQLASSMGWHRSRLSHHLTRMTERQLVERIPATVARTVIVKITATGRKLIKAARPEHAHSVRSNLLQHLSAQERQSIVDLAARVLTAQRS